MPRLRIIILDQPVNVSGSYNVLFWADVPAARQTHYANANATSAWTGALSTDNQALQNGSMAETSIVQTFPLAMAWPSIETYLQGQWQNYQNSVTNNNPWVRYGSTWDGTTWTLVTNG